MEFYIRKKEWLQGKRSLQRFYVIENWKRDILGEILIDYLKRVRTETTFDKFGRQSVLIASMLPEDLSTNLNLFRLNDNF